MCRQDRKGYESEISYLARVVLKSLTSGLERRRNLDRLKHSNLNIEATPLGQGSRGNQNGLRRFSMHSNVGSKVFKQSPAMVAIESGGHTDQTLPASQNRYQVRDKASAIDSANRCINVSLSFRLPET